MQYDGSLCRWVHCAHLHMCYNWPNKNWSGCQRFVLWPPDNLSHGVLEGYRVWPDGHETNAHHIMHTGARCQVCSMQSFLLASAYTSCSMLVEPCSDLILEVGESGELSEKKCWHPGQSLNPCCALVRCRAFSSNTFHHNHQHAIIVPWLKWF
jgi:hypothetical protein